MIRPPLLRRDIVCILSARKNGASQHDAAVQVNKLSSDWGCCGSVKHRRRFDRPITTRGSFDVVDGVIGRDYDRTKHTATRLTRACANRHISTFIAATVVDNGTHDAR